MNAPASTPTAPPPDPSVIERHRQPDSFWTPERIERLKVLNAEGRSYSQIAKAMSAPSRNAVGAKLYRLGLTKNEALTRSAKVHHARRRHAAKAPKTFPIARVITRAPYRAEVFETVLAGTTPRPWAERCEGECKWPIDLAGEIMSCCAPEERGGYCTGHARIAFMPSKPMTPRDLERTTRGNWRRAARS